MKYMIIIETDWGLEIPKYIKGTISLEKFTDSRIKTIYKKGKRICVTVGNLTVVGVVKSVNKLYPHSLCEVL